MAQTTRFLDGVPYTESQVAEVLSDFSISGVLDERIDGYDPLQLNNGLGLSVTINPGKAVIKGFWYKNTRIVKLAISANTSGSVRFDAIMLQLNRLTNEIKLVVVKGTPGAGVPLSTRNATIWQLAIGAAQINSGSTIINVIYDHRYIGWWYAPYQNDGTSYAGYVRRKHLAPNTLLDFTETGDVWNGAVLTAGTWYAATTALNFTVKKTGSVVYFKPHVRVQAHIPASSYMEWRLFIDGSLAYRQNVKYINVTGRYPSPGDFGGLFLDNLTAGVHSVALHVQSQNANMSIWLRPAVVPSVYSMSLQILEWER